MVFFLIFMFALLYVFFEVNYFLRTILVHFYTLLEWKMGRKTGFFEESIVKGICVTTDLDYNLHMNNARYLRECDFARHRWLIATSTLQSLRSLGGTCVTGASTIRYRRSIQLFETYNIRTRVLCWDDKAFYMEQKFERCSDNFVCAIVIVKMPVLKVSLQTVVDQLLGEGTKSPNIPEDVAHWIKYNEVSSAKLKAA